MDEDEDEELVATIATSALISLLVGLVTALLCIGLVQCSVAPPPPPPVPTTNVEKCAP